MKILHIVSYFPPHIGGMEICAKETAERLAKKGHKVKVFTSDIGCQKGKLKSIKNLKIHYLKSFEAAHTPIIPSLFFKLLKMPESSIIHLHIAQAFVPEIVWLVSKIRRIPYVAHMHLDVGPSGKLGFLLPLYKKYFLEKVLRSAKKIIVATTDYKEIVHRKYGISKNRIKIIPSGACLKRFIYRSKGAKKVKDILFVGRLAKQKNIPLLIKSFKKVLDRGYNLKLHLLGSGEEKENIVRLINQQKLGDRVILHGALPWEKLPETYLNFDLFILTSREESLGIVLIEAMASGLPIIASDIPGVRNVVKNNKTGLLVKPTPENFAKAIEEVINNPNLKEKLIRNCLKEVKKYDWDKIVEKFENVYREVLR